MYHPGERAVQARANVEKKANAVARIIGNTVPDIAAGFLAHQPFIVIGSPARDVETGTDRVWASQLHGTLGFITVPSPQTLSIEAQFAPTDPLAHAFDTEAQVGTIAIEPQSRDRMRANGHGHYDGSRLEIALDQVYSNCPKYITTRTVDHVDANSMDVEAVHGNELTDAQRTWIATADTFFVATTAGEFGTDASHRGGDPGFVRTVDSRHLVWPDYVGNTMLMTLGNLELDPRAGLLFLDWERGSTLQLSGIARTVWDERLASAFAGAQRLVAFTVERVIETKRALPLHWKFGQRSPSSPRETSDSSVRDIAAAEAVGLAEHATPGLGSVRDSVSS